MHDHTDVSILMIEDDSLDVEIFKRSLKKNRIANPFFHAKDGIEGLEVLRGDENNPPLKRPYLIVLDINMPRMNGIEFLKELRADKRLRDSVVFVMTTSSEEVDRCNAYDLNVAGYMVKTDIGGSFMKAIEMLDHYWRIVHLPNGGD